MTMGVELQHDRLPNLVNNTTGALILHRHIEVVAGLTGDGDILLPFRIREESVQRQIPEPLRDAPVGQGYPRLHWCQSSYLALGDGDSGGDERAFGFDEYTVGGKYVVIVQPSFAADSVRLLR